MRGELKNKIWLIISATFAFATLFGWYGLTLPVFYESKTLLTLRPPTISGKVVKSLTEEELEQKLFGMSQDILIRPTFEVLIGKYRLFETEKAKGMPIELIVDKMQKNIRISPTKNDFGQIRSFTITYRDTTPQNARNVAAELASKYVNAQVADSIEVVYKTAEFLETVRNQAEQELRKLEVERVKIFVKKIRDSRGKSFETECFSTIKIEMLYNQKWTALEDKKSLIGKKEIANVEYNLRLRANEKRLSDFTKEISKTEVELLKQYPDLKSALAEIDAKYQTAKENFEELTKKVNDAQVQVIRDSDGQGETISVIDPANLPNSPASVTAKDLALVGAGFGFIFSLFLLGLSSSVSYLNDKFGKIVLQ